MKAFRNFIRAARVTPSIFKGLSELNDSAQTKALRDRLYDKGFKFKGKYPSQAEIKEARRKKEEEDNLDGIDTSAILSPSRKRGCVCVRDSSYLNHNCFAHCVICVSTVGEKHRGSTSQIPRRFRRQKLKKMKKNRKRNLVYE